MKTTRDRLLALFVCMLFIVVEIFNSRYVSALQISSAVQTNPDFVLAFNARAVQQDLELNQRDSSRVVYKDNCGAVSINVTKKDGQNAILFYGKDQAAMNKIKEFLERNDITVSVKQVNGIYSIVTPVISQEILERLKQEMQAVVAIPEALAPVVTAVVAPATSVLAQSQAPREITFVDLTSLSGQDYYKGLARNIYSVLSQKLNLSSLTTEMESLDSMTQEQFKSFLSKVEAVSIDNNDLKLFCVALRLYSKSKYFKMEKDFDNTTYELWARGGRASELLLDTRLFFHNLEISIRNLEVKQKALRELNPDSNVEDVLTAVSVEIDLRKTFLEKLNTERQMLKDFFDAVKSGDIAKAREMDLTKIEEILKAKIGEANSGRRIRNANNNEIKEVVAGEEVFQSMMALLGVEGELGSYNNSDRRSELVRNLKEKLDLFALLNKIETQGDSEGLFAKAGESILNLAEREIVFEEKGSSILIAKYEILMQQSLSEYVALVEKLDPILEVTDKSEVTAVREYLQQIMDFLSQMDEPTRQEVLRVMGPNIFDMKNKVKGLLEIQKEYYKDRMFGRLWRWWHKSDYKVDMARGCKDIAVVRRSMVAAIKAAQDKTLEKKELTILGLSINFEEYSDVFGEDIGLANDFFDYFKSRPKYDATVEIDKNIKIFLSSIKNLKSINDLKKFLEKQQGSTIGLIGFFLNLTVNAGGSAADISTILKFEACLFKLMLSKFVSFSEEKGVDKKTLSAARIVFGDALTFLSEKGLSKQDSRALNAYLQGFLKQTNKFIRQAEKALKEQEKKLAKAEQKKKKDHEKGIKTKFAAVIKVYNKALKQVNHPLLAEIEQAKQEGNWEKVKQLSIELLKDSLKQKDINYAKKLQFLVSINLFLSLNMFLIDPSKINDENIILLNITRGLANNYEDFNLSEGEKYLFSPEGLFTKEAQQELPKIFKEKTKSEQELENLKKLEVYKINERLKEIEGLQVVLFQLFRNISVNLLLKGKTPTDPRNAWMEFDIEQINNDLKERRIGVAPEAIFIYLGALMIKKESFTPEQYEEYMWNAIQYMGAGIPYERIKYNEYTKSIFNEIISICSKIEQRSEGQKKVNAKYLKEYYTMVKKALKTGRIPEEQAMSFSQSQLYEELDKRFNDNFSSEELSQFGVLLEIEKAKVCFEEYSAKVRESISSLDMAIERTRNLLIRYNQDPQIQALKAQGIDLHQDVLLQKYLDSFVEKKSELMQRENKKNIQSSMLAVLEQIQARITSRISGENQANAAKLRELSAILQELTAILRQNGVDVKLVKNFLAETMEPLLDDVSHSGNDFTLDVSNHNNKYIDVDLRKDLYLLQAIARIFVLTKSGSNEKAFLYGQIMESLLLGGIDSDILKKLDLDFIKTMVKESEDSVRLAVQTEEQSRGDTLSHEAALQEMVTGKIVYIYFLKLASEKSGDLEEKRRLHEQASGLARTVKGEIEEQEIDLGHYKASSEAILKSFEVTQARPETPVPTPTSTPEPAAQMAPEEAGTFVEQQAAARRLALERAAIRVEPMIAVAALPMAVEATRAAFQSGSEEAAMQAAISQVNEERDALMKRTDLPEDFESALRESINAHRAQLLANLTGLSVAERTAIEEKLNSMDVENVLKNIYLIEGSATVRGAQFQNGKIYMTRQEFETLKTSMTEENLKQGAMIWVTECLLGHEFVHEMFASLTPEQQNSVVKAFNLDVGVYSELNKNGKKWVEEAIVLAVTFGEQRRKDSTDPEGFHAQTAIGAYLEVNADRLVGTHESNMRRSAVRILKDIQTQITARDAYNAIQSGLLLENADPVVAKMEEHTLMLEEFMVKRDAIGGEEYVTKLVDQLSDSVFEVLKNLSDSGALVQSPFFAELNRLFNDVENQSIQNRIMFFVFLRAVQKFNESLSVDQYEQRGIKLDIACGRGYTTDVNGLEIKWRDVMRQLKQEFNLDGNMFFNPKLGVELTTVEGMKSLIYLDNLKYLLAAVNKNSTLYSPTGALNIGITDGMDRARVQSQRFDSLTSQMGQAIMISA